VSLPDRHLRALRIVYSRLDGQPIRWALTGSAGMALQGVPVEVHDLDLQTDEQGAYALAKRLEAYVVTPVRWLESERIRSHLGKFAVEGVQVEVMGGIQKRLEDQSWEEPVQIELYRRWIEVEGMRLPVLSLEYEYQAYLRLGRSDQAERLRRWLHTQRPVKL
jgi:hypothetical protein